MIVVTRCLQHGCTARDIAIFNRRHDVIEVIDEHLIKFVRSCDMKSLYALALRGYDRIIVDFQVTLVSRLNVRYEIKVKSK